MTLSKVTAEFSRRNACPKYITFLCQLFCSSETFGIFSSSKWNEKFDRKLLRFISRIKTVLLVEILTFKWPWRTWWRSNPRSPLDCQRKNRKLIVHYFWNLKFVSNCAVLRLSGLTTFKYQISPQLDHSRSFEGHFKMGSYIFMLEMEREKESQGYVRL